MAQKAHIGPRILRRRFEAAGLREEGAHTERPRPTRRLSPSRREFNFEGLFTGRKELHPHQAPGPKREDGPRTTPYRRPASLPSPRSSATTTTWSSPASRILDGLQDVFNRTGLLRR